MFVILSCIAQLPTVSTSRTLNGSYKVVVLHTVNYHVKPKDFLKNEIL